MHDIVADKPSVDVSAIDPESYVSSPSGTTRTRAESMDSFESADDPSEPFPSPVKAAAAPATPEDDHDHHHHHHHRHHHSKDSEEEHNQSAGAPPEPKWFLVRQAYRINRWWVRTSNQGREATLRGVVGLAKLSAQYPYTTVVVCVGLAIGLIVGGYYTNFNVRLDMDKIFTPTSSELWEYAEFLGDSKMYDEIGNPSRQRRLMEGPVVDHTPPGEATFTWRDLQKLNQHRDLQKKQNLEEQRRRGLDSITGFDQVDLDTRNANASTTLPSEPTLSPTFNPSLRPDEIAAVSMSSNETAMPSVMPTTMLVPTMAPTEGRTWEPGLGQVFSILVHAEKKNVLTFEGMEKMWDLVDYLFSSEYFIAACTGSERSFHNFYRENTCEFRSVTRFWNHNRTLYYEKVKTEEDLFSTFDAVFYEDGGFVDLPFILAKMEEDENGRPVAAQAFYSWVYLKNTDPEFDLIDDLGELRQQWQEESDGNMVYVLEVASPHSITKEVMSAITGDLPLIPIAFVMMTVFTCLAFFKYDRLKSRTLLGLGAVTTVFMSTTAAYGLMFLCGKFNIL